MQKLSQTRSRLLLSVSIYRDAEGGDCSCNGVSRRFSKGLVLMKSLREDDRGPDATGYTPQEARQVACQYAEEESADEKTAIYIAVTRLISGEPYHTVVPLGVLQSGVQYMFGGNLAYSSDSRFFRVRALSIHDRVEK